MSVIDELLARNDAFAESFTGGDLPIKAKLPAIIVSCVDSRTHPAHYLGIENGDAMVIRAVGARATDAVVRDVQILGGLMKAAGAPGPPAVVIVHHTDCGTAKFVGDPLKTALVEASGADEAFITGLAVADPALTVAADAVVLAEAMPGSEIAGFVYDVRSGKLERIA